MSDEMIDIIDEHNVIVGQAMKSEAHMKGLRHRTILAEIKNSKGDWLLVKQSSSRQDAGQYVSPIGGHIQAGESEIEALKREALEEVGYSDFTHKKIGDANWDRSVLGRQENHYFILYEIYSDKNPILNDESDDYSWFSTPDLIREMKTHPKQFGDAWWFVVKEFYKDTFLI